MNNNQKKWFDSAAIKEDESKTTKNSKHLVLNNGTRRSIFTSSSINYYDKSDHKWKEIDNTLQETNDGYQAQIGNYTAKFLKECDKETVEVRNGANVISWKYLGTEKNPGAVSAKNITTKEFKRRKAKLAVKSTEQGMYNPFPTSRAVYENAEGNVNLDYHIEGDGIKENITVKEKAEFYKYYFNLSVNGFEIKHSPNGKDIEFYRENADATVPEFVMPAPFMYDSNGNRSDDVQYDMEVVGDGEYILAIEANSEWINDTERVFPVYLDPQLLKIKRPYITLSHERYQLCECESTACNESEWVYVSSPYYNYINVCNNEMEKINAILRIKKSEINLTRGDLISAKLVFPPYSGESYADTVIFKMNDKYFAHETGLFEVDITSFYNNSSDDFNLEMIMVTEGASRKYSMPILQVEYNPNTSFPVKKSFGVEDGVTAEFDVLSGNATINIEDIKDTVLGVAVSHVYKPNDDITEYGRNFRLNLDEKLVKSSTSSIGAQYVYTDAQGDVHTFKEHFYRIGMDGEKEYIESNISEINADADGRLWLNNREVFRELTTDRGLRASARLTNDVNNANWVEQRLDEEREVEEQVKSYSDTLCNFTSVDKDTGARTSMVPAKLKEPDEIEAYIAEIEGNSNLLLPKEEALSYKSLLTQKQSVYTSRVALVMQKESIKDSAKNLLLQYNAKDTFNYQTISDEVQLKLLEYERDNYNNLKGEAKSGQKSVYQNQINLIGEDNDTLSSKTRIGLVNYHKDSIILQQRDEWLAQKNNILAQISHFTEIGAPTGEVKGILTSQYEHLNTQINNVDEQMADIEKKLEFYVNKSTKYIGQFKFYYKTYLNLQNQLDMVKRQVPVSYLISDSGAKGFNAKGELVVVQDKYGKYIAFEREKYNTDGKTRISSVYDEDGNTMHFSYNANAQLSEICNSLGERATFRYNGFGDLVAIDRDNMTTLELSYISVGGINRIQNVASSNKTSTEISYTPIGMLKGITQNTAVIGITHDAIATGESTTLSTMNVDYTSTETTLTYDDIRKEIYRINQSDEQVDAYYELVSDKVTGAEQYVYDNYLLVQTKRADKSCLNRYSYDEFNDHMEIESVENITYNSFKELTKVVNSKYAALRTDSDLPLEQSETEYIYNDERKLIEKKTTHVYYNCCEAPDTTVSIEKYYYNNAGELVRKESYTEGEELKTGINIEEHVFNHKGVEIQSFTYNSLDPSSKFYTENEVDDKGRVLAAFDESGEHRTVFDYERDGVTVKTERLPNGSKFSYGRDKEDTVAAITHSTENGEENSTTQMRTLDVVTEIKSGNNTVQYTYDGKRRVKAVSLNGVDDYVTYTYSGEHTDADKVTATMADGTTVTTTKNAHGNVTKSKVGNKTVTNTYDDNQQFTKTVDSVSGETMLAYDDKGKVTAVIAPDHSESFVYDDKDVLTSKTVDGTTYEFAYKATADKTLDSISVDGNTVRPNTDALGRNTGKTIEVGENKVAEEKISYVKFGDHATNMPSNVRYATNGVFNESIQYKYDSMGNIVEVFENGRSVCRYEYDALGRLTREDNVAFGKTTTWAYDNNGNIIARYEYAITTKLTSELHLLNGTCKLYTYDDNSDQLMCYNGEAFEYDVIGNPTTYRGKTAVWEYGRQLKSYDGNTFSYDARGRRTAKNGITFTYDSNGNLIKQSNGLEFLYDHTGVFAVKYAGSTYFYRKDSQANIVALLDNTGAVVVKYKYDAWGKCQTTVVLDEAATEIATLNPFRYRSYYFDTETDFYFLKTRYYDPEIGRFITIDDISYLDPDSINGLNLYAYCLNNPIIYSDPTGRSATLAIILGIVALAGLITTCIGVGTNNNIVTAVGLTMVAIPALISGGMALVGGIATGATLTAIIGGVTALAGIGTGLFASAEYQEAFTGNNWILATTGMSEGWYNGLMIGIAAIATACTVASSFMRAFNIKTIQKVGRFGKYGEEGYRGIKFTIGNGKTRVLTFHTHSHIDGKTISQWHWQLQKWNSKVMEASGTVGKWVWWNLRRM